MIQGKGKKLLSLLLGMMLMLSIFPAAYASEPEASEAAAAMPEETPEEEAPEIGEWESRLVTLLQKYDVDPSGVGAGYLNLVTGEEHYLNTDVYRVSGSMYKVPLNMLFLNWYADGTLEPGETIYGRDYEELLRGTIVHSDNDEAEIMWDYAGATFQTDPGSTLYHRYRILIAPIMGEDPWTVDDKFYENNFFTPRQMIHCLKELYEGGLKYEPLVKAMQEAEPQKYFKLREKRFDIAHKYGWLAEGDILYLNDCALCFTDDPIAIVLFTTGINEPYKVLTEYCTMCCDYAQEERTARLAREAEEIAARAREEAETEEQQTQLIGAQESVMDEQPSQATETQNDAVGEEKETKLTLKQLVPVLLISVGMLAAILFLAFQRRFGLVLRNAILAVLLSGTAMLLCSPAMEGKNLFVTGAKDPGPVAEGFLNALTTGDWNAAEEYLMPGTSLGLQTEPEDEVAAAVLNAAEKSWKYSLTGDCEVEKNSARQKFSLRTLDFERMQEDLKTQIREELSEMSQTMDRDELYDADGNTRPEVAEKAYDRALLSLLEHAEDYYNMVETELTLSLTREGWKVAPDRALLTALGSGML